MKTPVTKEKVRNHITYSLWKYALLAVIGILGWNLIYSATEYQPPEEKKIIFGLYSYADPANLNLYMESVRLEQMPDMEDMSVHAIAPDDMYGAMVLSTRIATKECDIYLLSRDQFQGYAAQGAFMPLEEVLPDLIADLEAAGVSLSRGYRANDQKGGEKHQYAIPCDDLPGLSAMLGLPADDLYLSIFCTTGNDENVIRFFDIFVRDMINEAVTLPLE